MSKSIKIERFELPDDIPSEIYFSKFFPVKQLIKKGLMKRTKYGITLTKEFKSMITKQMEKLQLSHELILKFKERRYLEIDLEKLWNPIVCAVTEVNGCECTTKSDGVYISSNFADTIMKEASAIYQWFKHIKNVLKRANKGELKIRGDYV